MDIQEKLIQIHEILYLQELTEIDIVQFQEIFINAISEQEDSISYKNIFGKENEYIFNKYIITPNKNIPYFEKKEDILSRGYQTTKIILTRNEKITEVTLNLKEEQEEEIPEINITLAINSKGEVYRDISFEDKNINNLTLENIQHIFYNLYNYLEQAQRGIDYTFGAMKI